MPGTIADINRSGSGACSGHCGVFIKSWNGRGDCEYPGGDLKYGYNDLRNFGCTICGQNRYTNPKDVGCGMQIDYVSGC